MTSITLEEMETTDGGGYWFAALLIADGTTMGCMFGGGVALGGVGVGICTIAGAAAGIAALMS